MVSRLIATEVSELFQFSELSSGVSHVFMFSCLLSIFGDGLNVLGFILIGVPTLTL